MLPESLDGYVSDTNPVRVVDVFVDELDLVKLSFEGVIPADTWRRDSHQKASGIPGAVHNEKLRRRN